MTDDDKTREQAEEDAKEDLELTEEDADNVSGGFLKWSGTDDAASAGKV